MLQHLQDLNLSECRDRKLTMCTYRSATQFPTGWVGLGESGYAYPLILRIMH